MIGSLFEALSGTRRTAKVYFMAVMYQYIDTDTKDSTHSQAYPWNTASRKFEASENINLFS